MFLEVSDKTNFINIGVLIDGELYYIDVNFINNTDKWGILICKPDGRADMLIKPIDEMIECRFAFENNEYLLSVLPPHDGLYEITFEEL